MANYDLKSVAVRQAITTNATGSSFIAGFAPT